MNTFTFLVQSQPLETRRAIQRSLAGLHLACSWLTAFQLAASYLTAS